MFLLGQKNACSPGEIDLFFLRHWFHSQSDGMLEICSPEDAKYYINWLYLVVLVLCLDLLFQDAHQPYNDERRAIPIAIPPFVRSKIRVGIVLVAVGSEWKCRILVNAICICKRK